MISKKSWHITWNPIEIFSFVESHYKRRGTLVYNNNNNKNHVRWNSKPWFGWIWTGMLMALMERYFTRKRVEQVLILFSCFNISPDFFTNGKRVWRTLNITFQLVGTLAAATWFLSCFNLSCPQAKGQQKQDRRASLTTCFPWNKWQNKSLDLNVLKPLNWQR